MTTPIPVCRIHATFMGPYTLEEVIHKLPAITSCFRCSNLGCPLVYVFGDALEGYYTIEANGDLKRYW
jgi:hypothetical protein